MHNDFTVNVCMIIVNVCMLVRVSLTDIFNCYITIKWFMYVYRFFFSQIIWTDDSITFLKKNLCSFTNIIKFMFWVLNDNNNNKKNVNLVPGSV